MALVSIANHPNKGRSRLQERRRLQTLTLDISSVTTSDHCSPLSNGKDLLDRTYDVLDVLGQGTAGVVKRAKRRVDGQDVALKLVRTADAELLATARKEYELLQGVDHPNIIRALDFFVASDRAVLVLEFFPGYELDAFVNRQSARRLTEPIARVLFMQLLEAVDFLHTRRIIHRDIKGSNMLVSHDGRVLKLLDFNTAHQLASGGSLTMTGTHEYAAPEVLLGSSPSESSDVWSAGLCLHLMLTGRLPRRCDQYSSFREFVHAVTTLPVTLRGRQCWKENSEDCKAVLHQCLEIDQARRAAPITLLRRERWLSSDHIVEVAVRACCDSRGSSVSTCSSYISDRCDTPKSRRKRATSVPSSRSSSCSPRNEWVRSIDA